MSAHEFTTSITVIVIMLALIALVGDLDYQDEVKEEQKYCEMVAIWESESHLPDAERAGWPNFKNLDCSEAHENE